LSGGAQALNLQLLELGSCLAVGLRAQGSQLCALQPPMPLLCQDAWEGSWWDAGHCSSDSCPSSCHRWGVCVLLCCMVLLVVLCNALGLLLGPLGLKESVLPTQRSSLSNAGGNFFMA